MAEYKENSNGNNKRAWVETAEDSDANASELKRTRVDVDSGENSPEAKRIQDDLLNFLDDSEPDPAIQGLDSVIKSFEEEILVPESEPVAETLVPGESGPELGYLLEASDDELGLPPSFSTGNELKIETVDFKTSGSEPVNLENIALGFDDVLLNYETYNIGIGGYLDGSDTVSNDFITLGSGLFETYEPGDISEFACRPESLSAS